MKSVYFRSLSTLFLTMACLLVAPVSSAYDADFFADLNPKVWDSTSQQIIIHGQNNALLNYRLYDEQIEGPSVLDTNNRASFSPLIVRAGQNTRFVYASNEYLALNEVNELFVFIQPEFGPLQILKSSRSLSNGGASNYFESEIQWPAHAHGAVKFWFELRTKAGASVWDSKQGANYSLYVLGTQGSVIKFNANYTHQISQPLIAGQPLFIAYSVSRFYDKLSGTSYSGRPTYRIEAFVRYTDAHGIELARYSQPVAWTVGVHQVMLAGFPTPAQARGVQVWFKGSARGGVVYDSAWSKDYYFGVSP